MNEIKYGVFSVKGILLVVADSMFAAELLSHKIAKTTMFADLSVRQISC